MADLGLSAQPRDDHARYIANWLKALKDDKRAIFTAAARAPMAPHRVPVDDNVFHALHAARHPSESLGDVLIRKIARLTNQLN